MWRQAAAGMFNLGKDFLQHTGTPLKLFSPPLNLAAGPPNSRFIPCLEWVMRLPVAHSVSSVKAARSSVYVTSARRRPPWPRATRDKLKEKLCLVFVTDTTVALLNFQEICGNPPPRANQQNIGKHRAELIAINK